jgi:hypothetical protein
MATIRNCCTTGSNWLLFNYLLLSSIGVKMSAAGRIIKFNDNGKIIEGDSIPSTVIWLRSKIDKDGVNTYFYSFNGQSFQLFGRKYLLKWDGYRCDNIGIYNYNNLNECGFIDINWFHYQF